KFEQGLRPADRRPRGAPRDGPVPRLGRHSDEADRRHPIRNPVRPETTRVELVGEEPGDGASDGSGRADDESGCSHATARALTGARPRADVITKKPGTDRR